MPSTAIRFFHYDAAARILRVQFVSGLIYDYKNVPASAYEQMKASFSKGKFLNEEIKGKYSFEKID